MLVREAQNDRALVYIDQLSYAFRYIIQNGQNMLVRLDEEARFAEAYSYLFKIRYTDKLFFDIRIDAEYRDWLLPALSLQPLMGNAVKHNAITRSQPFHVRISTEKGVSDRLQPEDSEARSRARHRHRTGESAQSLGADNRLPDRGRFDR